MKIEFTKMQGAGNDYIYIDCLPGEPSFDPGRLAAHLSRRRLSVGADGLVLICPSDKADVRMRMFNADGSEGMMCGNALRCVAKYLYERGICDKKVVEVETASGIRYASVLSSGEVTAYIGRAEFGDGAAVTAGGREYVFCRVSVGNPHAVCFTGGVRGLDLGSIGPVVENAPVFGERVNAEFAEAAKNGFDVRVWERGSGETLACGTGACAVAAAAVRSGKADAGEEIAVNMRGGVLKVRCTGSYELYLTGGAVTVYDGVTEYAEDRDQR